VPGESWQCSSCHKNNVAGAVNCATCGRKPAAAKPVTPPKRGGPTKPKPMTAKEREQVLSTSSDEEPARPRPPAGTGRVRGSGGGAWKSSRPRTPSTDWRMPLEEPTLLVPELARISIAPPPVRSSPPAAPAAPSYPRRRSHGRLVKIVLSVAALILAWQVGIPWVQGFIAEQAEGSGYSSDQTSTAQPCPPEAAAALPGQVGVLLARYQTTKHVITVCQTSDGQVFYDGQIKGQAPGPDTHISLPAQPTGDGYVAHNLTYTYQITGGRVVVTNAGTVLLDEVLQPA
jgi:hypothetical protein